MRKLLIALTLASATLSSWAFAQVPAIESGGVQNAASNIPLTSIAPQVLIAIKGQHLATSTASAKGYPLPTTLGGARVTFTGVNGPMPAPLLYASPTQINAQVPNGIGGTLGIIVTTGVGSSTPYTIPLVTGKYPGLIAPLGIFTQDGTGCGQAVAFNIHSDGSPMSLNTPQNSLDPQKDLGLAIFLTGLGGLDFSDRPDAAPWVFNNNDNLAPKLVSSVTLGVPGLTASANDLTLAYLGPAPGKVGIDQANVLSQSKGGPQGCRVPLSLALLQPQTAYTGGTLPAAALASTQLVDVSIRPGGGVCVDQPDNGLGIITWQEVTLSDVGGLSSTEAVTAQFIQSNGLGFSQSGPFPQPLPTSDTQQTVVYGPLPAPQPACNASLPNTLDAGALTLSVPNFGSMAFEPSTMDGRLTYRAKLAPGTLQAGSYQVTGAGGSQVGAFSAGANIPPPITITTNLQPGTQLPFVGTLALGVPGSEGGSFYLPFQWTGGDDRSIVTVQLIFDGFQAVGVAYGGAGGVWITDVTPCNQIGITVVECAVLPQGSAEVIITQTPFSEPSNLFNAPGLAWGGETTWKYVWDFRGLSN